ncbi:uncharacterized protein J8A68_001914 [[Candida] subhashii]|uniref:Protein MSS2, mitochondrial n=1 Tax=[Candida] subhashii TaxID=561895 RepID=A0A8J5QSR9_9ASCO|nr:uncharacterized protein J8A68_001914 [[Candida] subhashii]KAG7664552.1 hypothetical protein J8A68_001914 [[Candida] subhashii]
MIRPIVRRSIRLYSTATNSSSVEVPSDITSRPSLLSILPSKRTINRILFDNDARLPYKKMMPVLSTIYDNLDTPSEIKFPKYVKPSDLMTFKSVLGSIRVMTHSMNRNLVRLENELVEQAAELGDNDAITILAFETVRKKVKGQEVTKEDYQYANDLIKQLTDLKHPLVFKMGGDLAFEMNVHEKAKEYWLDFIKLQPDTIMASHVYCNLGMYYFSYGEHPDLKQAKLYFEKSIRFGEIDKYTIKAHYYLGQLYAEVDPRVSKYHWEVSASQGLKESFQSLGFLEMNIFENFEKALEWFKLGVEASNDVACLIGQFDVYFKMKKYQQGFDILDKLETLQEQFNKAKLRGDIPDDMKSVMELNKSLLETFFNTRTDDIKLLTSRLG